MLALNRWPGWSKLLNHEERPDGSWGDDLRPTTPRASELGEDTQGKLEFRCRKSTLYRTKATRNKAASGRGGINIKSNLINGDAGSASRTNQPLPIAHRNQLSISLSFFRAQTVPQRLFFFPAYSAREKVPCIAPPNR